MPARVAANIPVPGRVGRRRPRRWAVAGLATICLSTLLVVAPAPRLASSQDLQVRTEHVRLGPRLADRARDVIGAAHAADGEGPELRSALDAAGRRASPRTSATYHALGITVPVAPDEPVLVRGRVDGTWTPWLELPFAPGEAPDQGTEGTSAGVHSEPVWLGDADAYELDAPATVDEVDVHLVDDGPASRELEVGSARAGAAGAPSILSRSAWGARPPRQHPTTTADLKLAIVHHSVNGNTYSAGQVPELLRSIQAYHQDVKGWKDIAYNFLVDRFGRVWEGRAGGTTNVVVGGHSQGFNTGAVGVVVLGDFRTAAVPSASVEAVAQVIAWKFAIHRVDPASTVPFTSAGSAKYPAGTTVTLPRIVGHRDVQATDCPGAQLHSKLGTIRARVAQLVPGYQQALAPLVLDPDFDGDGLVDPLQYHPGRTADVRWRATATGQFTRTATSVNGAYRPVVGDFDGNGRSDVLWHGTGSAMDPLWWSGPTGVSTQLLTVRGSYVPLAGDFDGNGVDDIFWYSTGPAPDSVWYFEADRSHVAIAARQDLVTGVPVVGDYDANGRDDIFWYGPGSASDSLWRSTGRTWTVSAPAVNGWYDPVALEATGDGRDDILWFAPASTTSYRWDFGTLGSHTSRALRTASLLGRPAVGDFDGDGLEDVLLAAAGGAADQVWYSTPTGIVARTVSVNGRYATTVGAMDAKVLTATDDVLFLSHTGDDYLWQGLPDRTFRSTRVG